MSKKRRETKAAKRPKKEHPLPANGAKLAEMERYGLFLSLPRKERTSVFGYDTDLQFAKDYGVNNATLSEWKWNPKLWEFRDKYLTHFKKHTAEILSKLAERAKRTGEAFHTLSYMKLVEGWTEKSGVDITSKGKRVSGFKLVLHEPGRPDRKIGVGD